ncbi:pilus assembly protein [Alicyclobacillaceae bacterium I2511]|nr:pilus assembly protein [Alicyclobacillaceae bacterium I2511]
MQVSFFQASSRALGEVFLVSIRRNLKTYGASPYFSASGVLFRRSHVLQLRDNYKFSGKVGSFVHSLWTPKNHARRDEGQALIEFALVLPVFLLLLLGIIEFGLIFSKYLTLEEAARNGARSVSLGYSASDVCSQVEQNAGVSATGVQFNPGGVCIPTSSWSPGEEVTVLVTAQQPILDPLISSVLGRNFMSLTASATMRVEG